MKLPRIGLDVPNQGPMCLMVTTCASAARMSSRGRAREHMCGCAGSCPDDIMREQRVVREASQLLRVPKGRYSAHRVTGRVANLVGAGFPHTAACCHRESLFVQSIRTADERHDRFFVNDEDERLDDLGDVAADRSSSIVRGSRAVRERTNLDLQSATRRRGDQTIRASHARPTNGGRLRIATTTPRQAQSTHGPTTYIPGAKSHSPPSLSDSGRSGFGPIGLFAQPDPGRTLAG